MHNLARALSMILAEEGCSGAWKRWGGSAEHAGRAGWWWWRLGEMSRRALRLWEGGGGKRTAKARPCGGKQQLSW